MDLMDLLLIMQIYILHVNYESMQTCNGCENICRTMHNMSGGGSQNERSFRGVYRPALLNVTRGYGGV